MTITLQAVNDLIQSLESAGELSIKETKVMALAKAFKQLAAENVGLKVERAEMVAIGELIRTQDNRITDQPFFAVMAKREIITSEDHDYDRICWVENQSGDYVEATDTQRRRLEAIYQRRYEVRDGWDRYVMKEIDVFVTGCFTEQGCKDYISLNGHNLNKPFIYAFGSYRNNEYQSVRKFIMGIPETPATDRIVAGIKADAAAPLVSALKVIANSEQHNGDTVVCDFDTLISVAACALRDYYAMQLREGADK